MPLIWKKEKNVAATEESTPHLPGQPREVAAVDDRLVADALKLIWMQNEMSFNVDDLTKQLPTTRRSLERRFRAAVGHTILDEIIRCRFQRAQRLLRKTEISITQVAITAGFSSINNMGLVFRRFMGITPKAYRQLSREKSESEPSK